MRIRLIGLMGLMAAVVLAAAVAGAADITPGYTFVSGEQNVTHTKLNNAASGSINTSFLSGKASAGANPAGTMQILLRDTSADVFKRSTLTEAVFDHTSLLSARTQKASPVGADQILIADSADSDAYKRSYLSNIVFGGGSFFTSVVTNEDLIPLYDSSAGTFHRISVSNLIATAMAATSLNGEEQFMVLDGSRRIRRMKLEDIVSITTEHTTGLTGLEQLPVLFGGALERMAIVGVHTNAPKTAPVAADKFGLVNAGINLESMTWQSIQSNVQPAYVLVRSEQASGTSEGLTNVWSVRTLNTEVEDKHNIASVSANAVTLAAGIYQFRVTAPAHQVGVHQCMLTNETDGIVVALGQNARAGTADTSSSTSVAAGRFTNSAAKVYGVRHRCTTSNTADGGGLAGSWGTEVYTMVEFWRETP